MKEITFVRHGKSSWESEFYEDFNRPLKPRGIKDAKIMAENILKKDKVPDAVFISKAKRASETGLIITKYSEIPQSIIFFEEILYTFEWHNLLTFIRHIDDSFARIWIVGHNPALTEVINYLSFEKKILNLQTAGVCTLALDILSWEGAKKDCGDLVQYHYPKEFKLHSDD